MDDETGCITWSLKARFESKITLKSLAVVAVTSSFQKRDRWKSFNFAIFCLLPKITNFVLFGFNNSWLSKHQFRILSKNPGLILFLTGVQRITGVSYTRARAARGYFPEVHRQLFACGPTEYCWCVQLDIGTTDNSGTTAWWWKMHQHPNVWSVEFHGVSYQKPYSYREELLPLSVCRP